MTWPDATWRKLIGNAMDAAGESWADVVAHTLTDDDLDREFDSSWGVFEGCPFTLWTYHRVYFPFGYDGAEGVISVPRNPCDERTEHVGWGG